MAMAMEHGSAIAQKGAEAIISAALDAPPREPRQIDAPTRSKVQGAAEEVGQRGADDE
jgi:hypothetical protein